MTDKLPALNGVTSSEAFTQHLNALHEARKAYIQTESNERVRRALRTKVRAAEQTFENGEAVFYKREGKERWLGPARVVFQDGKVVFIRHGGIFVRVSPIRLTKIHDTDCQNRAEKPDRDYFDENEVAAAETRPFIEKPETRISETVPAPTESPEEIQDQDERRETLRSTINPMQVKVNDVIRYKVNDE